jgi:hypothetical protein
MDSQRFDALTRWLGGCSRRQVLSALAAGLLGHVLNGPGAEEAAAACKGFNAKCKRSGNCCADAGLRCVKVGKKKKGKKTKKRCRCKNGTCPDQTPCCVRGKCEGLCGNGMVGETCCADCFVLINGQGVPPEPNSDQCCPQHKICSKNPKKLSDDRCCSESEDCVDSTCCSQNGAFGAIVCGGKCCPRDACCNGTCCPAGQVCAETPNGDQCAPADRTCRSDPECFSNEECRAGKCCAENRQCSFGGSDFCCPAGQYCEQPGSPQACCPINTTCNSFKGHRVRR